MALGFVQLGVFQDLFSFPGKADPKALCEWRAKVSFELLSIE